MLGKIHSIESFGTVDGPGIRFVVFMQGCILKCKYCHNRDTWDMKSGKEITVQELVNEIKRYKPYMDTSNGGVTISGGEPLLQSEFLIDLFKQLKRIRIHTALDTSGALPITDKIKELLKFTDLVLLDIKHIDDNKCISLTGQSNKNTLEFAKYLNSQKIPIWIRQVLVPGITDDEKDLSNLRNFLDTLEMVKKVEVLPYHNMGKFKWKELGDIYPLENTPLPSKELIDKAKSILRIND